MFLIRLDAFYSEQHNTAVHNDRLASRFGPLSTIGMKSAEMHPACLLIEELLNEVSVTSTKWRGKREKEKRYRKGCVNRVHEGGLRLYLMWLMDSLRKGAGKIDLKRSRSL